MSFIFNSIAAKRPKKNVFDMSNDVKLSCNMGQLIPFMCEEIVPGDRFKVNTQAFVRMSPMVAPIMHRLNVYTHYFFVPNRIIWDNWETFITGGPDGNSSPVFPRIRLSGPATYGYLGDKTLADYLGIGLGNKNPSNSGFTEISQLPFRAYQKIYNEYYRDQNLTSEINIPTGDGIIGDSPSLDPLISMRRRCFEKDYFTAALPWAQRGADATLPVEPETSSYTKDVRYDNSGSGQLLRHSDGSVISEGGTLIIDPIGPDSPTGVMLSNGDVKQIDVDPNGTYKVDVDIPNGSFTINNFRRAIRLQEWLEKNARGGARYIEQILSHFGVTSSDARLQRPEFLGGGKSPIVISEVLQTSSTDETSPQANMSGHGISAGSNHAMSRRFEEHGYLIGIMSILPRTAYQQGIPRHFLKFDKFDYYFPSFAHLGEQPVYNKELYHDPDDSLNDEPFGYQPRYVEYKYRPSRVHGDFKTNLNFWHMSRIFDSRPRLNTSFVTANQIDRIFAVEDPNQDKYWVQLHNNVRAIRPMPKYGTPTI